MAQQQQGIGIPDDVLETIGLQNVEGIRSVKFDYGYDSIWIATVEFVVWPDKIKKTEEKKEEPKQLEEKDIDLEDMSVEQLETRMEELQEEMEAVTELLLVKKLREEFDDGDAKVEECRAG